jgi:hypothetical protein
MKPILLNSFEQTTVTILFVLSFLITNPVVAGYEIKWQTIDGGGGTSTGGAYSLTGTIGQPDAAYSEGGPYEVLGGFWPGGPECIVNFRHFARFAEWWLETGTGLPADLYEDENNIVDWLDLGVFVDEWLYYCPYDWLLR